MLPYDYIKGYAEEFYSKPSYHTREALLNSILNHQQGDDPNFRIRCTDKVVREYNERHEEKIAGKSLLKEIEKKLEIRKIPGKSPIKDSFAKRSKKIVSNKSANYDPWWSISKGNGKKDFIPPELAKFLAEKYYLIYDKSDYFYFEDGYFKGEGEAFLKRIIKEQLGNDYRENRAREVLYSIRAELEADFNNKLIESTKYINVNNGMLDWKSKKLEDHEPMYKSSIRIPVEYKPDAKCPAIERFINEILPGESDTHKLIYEMIGYCLIPDTKMEKWFILNDINNTGCNGKSTLLNVIKVLLGSENFSTETLQDLSTNRFRMANLYGKLANIHPDINDEGVKYTGILKALVSGEEQTVERKNKDPFQFANKAKLIFSCNRIPHSRDNTNSYYRRVSIIPFPQCFENVKDENLKFKLTTPTELSGLLNLAIDGLNRLMYKGRFTEPLSVKVELANYKKDNENVSQFIEDECIFFEDLKEGQECWINKSSLYGAYQRWCKESGVFFFSKNKFNDKIKGIKGVTEVISKKEGKTQRIWSGIDLQDRDRFLDKDSETGKVLKYLIK